MAASSNVASKARLAAQAADRKAVVAKTKAAPKVPAKTPTKTATKVLATPKLTDADRSITTTGDEGVLRLGLPDREAVMQANIDLGYMQPAAPQAAPWSLPQAAPWSLESDPLYTSALAAGQAQFNYARNAALADKQTQELGLSNQRKALDTSAAEARRRTAGNYAARGMAGGAAGALSLAEAQANANQIAARTGIADQITALNNNFLQNYGDVTAKNYDWTGTLTGQQYKTQAAQAALEAALSRLGTV